MDVVNFGCIDKCTFRSCYCSHRRLIDQYLQMPSIFDKVQSAAYLNRGIHCVLEICICSTRSILNKYSHTCCAPKTTYIYNQSVGLESTLASLLSKPPERRRIEEIVARGSYIGIKKMMEDASGSKQNVCSGYVNRNSLLVRFLRRLRLFLIRLILVLF